jgi:hypothetical protein
VLAEKNSVVGDEDEIVVSFVVEKMDRPLR